MDPREEGELGFRRRKAEIQGEEGLSSRGKRSWDPGTRVLAPGVGAQRHTREQGQQRTPADPHWVSKLTAHLCHRRHSYRTGQDIANCGTCRDCACIIYR